MTTKVCSKCKVEKDLGEFHKAKRSKDGLHNMCKKCRDVLNAKWRAENPEKVRVYRAKGRAKNREKVKERQAKWYAENQEKMRAYRAKYRAENPEKLRVYCAKYRAENQEKMRAYRAENQEKMRAYHVKWRADLHDSYVIQQLKNPNPPQELIELKRIQLRIYREIYKKGDAQS